MVRKVLIVDDNKDAADSFAAVLRLRGHDARVVYSGRDAVATALTWTPEVVFVDLAMPWIHGFDLLRELRELPGMSKVKLVCLTGFGDEKHRDLASAAGCDGYLVKPAEIADVQSVLDSVDSPSGAPV